MCFCSSFLFCSRRMFFSLRDRCFQKLGWSRFLSPALQESVGAACLSTTHVTNFVTKIHQFLYRKIWFTPPPKRAQNKEKLYKIHRKSSRLIGRTRRVSVTRFTGGKSRAPKNPPEIINNQLNHLALFGTRSVGVPDSGHRGEGKRSRELFRTQIV